MQTGIQETTTYTYAVASNRLDTVTEASGAVTYQYDAAGNTLDDGDNTYGYDDRNRLVTANDPSTQQTVDSYRHNALGQRVIKTVNGVTTRFAYDEAGHLIGEYDALGNAIRQYVWFGDRPIAMLVGNGSTSDVYYIHSDHLNTPQVVTDQNQQVVWKGDYTPFGDVEEIVSNVELPLRFPGQYEDEETGLNYNYFRTYSSATGRYTQSDPIGLLGGPNTYSYVTARPIVSVDPSGLLDWTGSFQVKSLGFGKIGGLMASFSLESECDLDGRKATVEVEGISSSIGIGPLIGSEIAGKVTFTDGQVFVNPSVFAGDFTIDSIGFQFGKVGLGKTNIYLGQAVATDVSTESGLDIGLQFGVEGTALITKFEFKDCGCN